MGGHRVLQCLLRTFHTAPSPSHVLELPNCIRPFSRPFLTSASKRFPTPSDFYICNHHHRSQLYSVGTSKMYAVNPSKSNPDTGRDVRGLREKLGEFYPFGGPKRLTIPEGKMSWDDEWEEYKPPTYTIPGILKGDKTWADPEIGCNGFHPKWNEFDGKLCRKSWEGDYKVSENGYPLNPVGRTGMQGRGSLGKWGPNHAADAVVTRWKTDENGEIVKREIIGCPGGKRVLQFIAILRQDTGELAIPGGMIDPGEDPFEAGKRECLEEVFGLEEANVQRQDYLQSALNDLFEQKRVIYRGYVDDRRSTDNAWIETHAVNYHMENKEIRSQVEKVGFRAGSDAKSALWVDIHGFLNLYASHRSIILEVVQFLDAYYGIE